MKDKLIEFAPAKINLFLKILNKRKDSYYNIRSGVTFINLFDEILFEKNTQFTIKYIGDFAPENNIYTDCIVEKLFETFSIKKPKYNIIIKKNIPVQSGLGSASSDAATIFRILEKLNIFKINNIKDSIVLGSDLPLFLNEKDCLIRGRGDKITNTLFPKYYFLLIKPLLNCNTKKMYSLIDDKTSKFDLSKDIGKINEFDNGNDFEKILIKSNDEINQILIFLKQLKNVIFASLTGSGSCCYAAFDNRKNAVDAQNKFKYSFPNLWSFIAENNFIS